MVGHNVYQYVINVMALAISLCALLSYPSGSEMAEYFHTWCCMLALEIIKR